MVHRGHRWSGVKQQAVSVVVMEAVWRLARTPHVIVGPVRGRVPETPGPTSSPAPPLVEQMLYSMEI